MLDQGLLHAEVDCDLPEWFRTALADEPHTGTVRVQGAGIAWRAWGRPSTEGVVLIHGGAAHARWWDHVAPLLVEERRRVVAVDLSGHGDSAHRDRYGLDVWVDEIDAVADAAGLHDRITIVGHSLGGLVALRTAVQRSARFASVIVVDSPLREPSPEERAAREGRAFGPLRVYPDRDEALARFRPLPDQPVIDFISAHVADHSLRAVPGGWSWKFDPAVLGFVPPADWPPVPAQTEVVLIRGERGILPRRIGPEVREMLGDTGAMIEIPDAGHHLMLDQPLALISTLRAVLARTSPP